MASVEGPIKWSIHKGPTRDDPGEAGAGHTRKMEKDGAVGESDGGHWKRSREDHQGESSTLWS